MNEKITWEVVSAINCFIKDSESVMKTKEDAVSRLIHLHYNTNWKTDRLGKYKALDGIPFEKLSLYLLTEYDKEPADVGIDSEENKSPKFLKRWEDESDNSGYPEFKIKLFNSTEEMAIGYGRFSGEEYYRLECVRDEIESIDNFNHQFEYNKMMREKEIQADIDLLKSELDNLATMSPHDLCEIEPHWESSESKQELADKLSRLE